MQGKVIYLKFVDPKGENPDSFSWHIVWDAATFIESTSDRYMNEKEKRHVHWISEEEYYEARWPGRKRKAA